MTPIAAFILGLIIGWLVEWVIDWVYWRRRGQASSEADTQTRQRIAGLEQELAQQKQAAKGCEDKAAGLESSLSTLQQELDTQRERCAQLEREKQQLEEQISGMQGEMTSLRAGPGVAVPLVPDDLEVIKGIGPVIAKRLNQAGIFTFEQLGAQTPTSLRALLGDVIERLSDEESILEQARQIARRKQGRNAGEQ